MALGCFLAAAVVCFFQQPDETGRDDDYSQWKLALGVTAATNPEAITRPEGFTVELLRSSGPGEGSWISCAFDPKGRLLVSRESRGILRFTLSTEAVSGEPLAPGRGVAVVELVDDSLMECRGLLFAHGALYTNANNSRGLYRLRDANGDDVFDEMLLLRSTPGNVGHGRNDLALGPDGMIYSIHGDDVFLPQGWSPLESRLTHMQDPRLFPCAWDKNQMNSYVQLPAGQLIRTDKDGRTWEVVAGGMRNPYGIDFSPEGELFTYDADMEWDISAPWYRPTRVLHLVSGADFGWRLGTGSWPAWYADSLPPVVDIGLGSPTAIKFGAKSRFPDEWKRSLFIADWAYGRVLAIHLQPTGASYKGEAVPFLSGRPLNVTDLEVGPDGALYFLTGGRGTVSGLYRVRYVGKQGGKATAADEHSATRELRRSLEKFHRRSGPEAIEAAWPHLNAEDAFIRHAARVAIEHQPTKSWSDRIESETRPLAAATALLAFARGGDAADKSRWFTLWTKNAATPRDLTVSLSLLRALTYQLSRHGLPDETTTAAVRRWLEVWPSNAVEERHQLCELLAFFGSSKTVETVLRWFDEAKTQEERLRYLYVMRNVAGPWTDPQRRRFFEYLKQARQFDGAQNMPKFISWIHEDSLSHLPDDIRSGYAAMLQQGDVAAVAPAVINRPFVRKWELDDLVGSLQFQASERSFDRGKQMFEAALCIRCHRVGKTGTAFGPDLGSVSSRFSRADILRSVLHPSTVIDEKYRGVIVQTKEGKTISGQQLREDEKLVEVLADPFDPNSAVSIPRGQIEELIPSAVSPMPAGLLDTLSKQEILDLLYFLEQYPTAASAR